MARELLEKITPEHWDSPSSARKPVHGTPQQPISGPVMQPTSGNGYNRVRWLQGLNDLIRRPVASRGSISTSATAVTCNAAIQSTGIGLPNALNPKRYAEFTVKARVTFNINSAGPAFVYVYRTLGAIPANGAAPGGADVIVGGDSFTGGPTTSGVNQSASFSFLDTGLDVTKKYLYYLAVKGTNTNTLNLINSSQLLVMERS